MPSQDGTVESVASSGNASEEPNDTDVLDTDVPDTDVPDADAPDTDVPDADVPDTEVPDTEVHDAVTLGVAGDHVAVRDSVVGALAAGTLEAEDTFIVLGAVGSLEGNSRERRSARAAVLMGLLMGLTIAVVRWLVVGGAKCVQLEMSGIESEEEGSTGVA